MSSLLIANCTFHSACLHKWSCIYSFYRQTATTGNTNKLPSFTVIFLDLVEICNFFGGCRIWIVIIIINLLLVLSYYCIEKGHKWASEEVLRTGYMLYSSIALVIGRDWTNMLSKISFSVRPKLPIPSKILSKFRFSVQRYISQVLTCPVH